MVSPGHTIKDVNLSQVIEVPLFRVDHAQRVPEGKEIGDSPHILRRSEGLTLAKPSRVIPRSLIIDDIKREASVCALICGLDVKGTNDLRILRVASDIESVIPGND